MGLIQQVIKELLQVERIGSIRNLYRSGQNFLLYESKAFPLSTLPT
ncbi:hypothetical protein GCM10010954_11160 [Halobacillus andaensis]|uniref:Uncharacterized protein n=1 Tax=Halobacillus andaensis TaxID=1176239 RepID=A0A917B041_HALAA|nr:hypothetical protein [Halobacillus andaensis]GGF14242.1 hypothetical protein GCM10010954_11160 [Halobacillus andaensis]